MAPRKRPPPKPQHPAENYYRPALDGKARKDKEGERLATIKKLAQALKHPPRLQKLTNPPSFPVLQPPPTPSRLPHPNPSPPVPSVRILSNTSFFPDVGLLVDLWEDAEKALANYEEELAALGPSLLWSDRWSEAQVADYVAEHRHEEEWPREVVAFFQSRPDLSRKKKILLRKSNGLRLRFRLRSDFCRPHQ